MTRLWTSALLQVLTMASIAAAQTPAAADISNQTIQQLMEKKSGDDIIRMINAGTINVGVAEIGRAHV